MIGQCGFFTVDQNASTHAVEFDGQEYYCPQAAYRAPSAWWYVVVWVVVKQIGRPLVAGHWLDK